MEETARLQAMGVVSMEERKSLDDCAGCDGAKRKPTSVE